MCSALRNGGEFKITECEVDDSKWLKINEGKTKGIRLDFEIAGTGKISVCFVRLPGEHIKPSEDAHCTLAKSLSSIPWSWLKKVWYGRGCWSLTTTPENITYMLGNMWPSWWKRGMEKNANAFKGLSNALKRFPNAFEFSPIPLFTRKVTYVLCILREIDYKCSKIFRTTPNVFGCWVDPTWKSRECSSGISPNGPSPQKEKVCQSPSLPLPTEGKGLPMPLPPSHHKEKV